MSLRLLRTWAGLAVAAVSLGATVGAYARYIEPELYETVTLSLTIPRWPRELDGFLLALVGDIHEGVKSGRRWTTPALDAAVDAVRLARPDAVVLAGDYVFGQWESKAVVPIIDRFVAPTRVAVLGNHDYGRGQNPARELALALERAGFDVLLNEARCYSVRGVDLWFCGLGDSVTDNANVEVALTGLPDDASPTIAVTHVPDLADDLPPGRFDLILSGHTHGGQIALPKINWWVLRRGPGTRYDRGLYTVNGIPLYVTKGLGMVGYHARFRARPEAVFLRLHALNGSSPPAR